MHGVYPAMGWTTDSSALVFWAGGKIHRLSLPATLDRLDRRRRSRGPGDGGRRTRRPLPRARPAPGHRGVALPGRGRAGDLPAAHDSLRADLSRRQAGGLPGARQALGEGAAGRAAGDARPRSATTSSTSPPGRGTASRSSTRPSTTACTAACASLRPPPAAGARAGWSRPSRVTTSNRCSLPTASRSSTAKGRATTCADRRGAGMTGIYVVPAAGGEPTLVTDDGAQPQFGAAGDRVYLMRVRRRGQAFAGLAHPRRRRPAHPRDLRGRDRVPALARTASGWPSRALQRLRDAVRADGQGGRRRAESERRAGRAGVEGRRRRRCTGRATPESALVAGAGAVLARPQGRRSPSWPARRRRSRSRRPPAAARLRLHLCEARWTDGAGRRADRDHAARQARRGDRARSDRDRRQPHHRRRAALRCRGVSGRRHGHRRRRQDDHPRPRRRALARRPGQRPADPAAELDRPGQPRLRRDHDPRPVQRHGRRSSPPPSCRRRASSSRRASSRPARSSTAPRATSRPRSTRWTTRCSNLRRLKAVGAFSVKSYNQPRREQRQQVLDAGARARHDGGARRRLAPRPEHDHGGRRPHRRRALAAGRRDLRRRHPAVERHRSGLHADARSWPTAA